MFKSYRQWFSLVRQVRHLERTVKKLENKLAEKQTTIGQLLDMIKGDK